MSNKKKLGDLNLAFCDVETTGLDSKINEIIEIAVVIYNPKEDKIIKEWAKKAAPRNIKTANKIALDMNGYNEDPKSYVGNIKDVIIEFNKIVEDCVIIGQNIQFDIGFIDKYYKEFSLGCEIHRHRKLEISSMSWPILRKTDLKSYSLATQCEYFNISNEGEHRALTDCIRTLEVYKCLIKAYKM